MGGEKHHKNYTLTRTMIQLLQYILSIAVVRVSTINLKAILKNPFH